jgi:DNA-directed RNA polymerase subunit K/omega
MDTEQERVVATPTDKQETGDEVPTDKQTSGDETATVDEEDTDDDEEDSEDDEEDDEEEAGDEEDEDDGGDAGPVPTPQKKPSRKKKNPSVTDGEPEDDEDEVEQVDQMSRMDYLETHHPEVIFPDSSELQAILATYTRNENPVIRKSRPILSKYEAASIVGMRSQQIVQGSAPLVTVPTDDPIEIAQAELNAKIIPVVIRRILPNGVAEYWRLSELRYYD